MNSLQKWLVIAGVAVMSACAVASEEATNAQFSAEAGQPQGASWRERYLLLGKDSYQRGCANCHDEGVDGAPTIGDRDTWSARSPLWSAVLAGHAKNGYLNMPARGGHPELTDREVEAAMEYMLGETFPELPVD